MRDCERGRRRDEEGDARLGLSLACAVQHGEDRPLDRRTTCGRDVVADFVAQLGDECARRVRVQRERAHVLRERARPPRLELLSD